MRVQQVKGGLHSCICELGRVTKTRGFHYSVVKRKGQTIIKHHGGKWKVTIEPDEHTIVVTASNDTLEMFPFTALESMLLNGEWVDAIQPVGDVPIKTSEIINDIKNAIGKWAVAKAFCIQYADGIIPSTH